MSALWIAGVDWAELEKTEGEHTKDQSAEEVGYTITRTLHKIPEGTVAPANSNASQGTAFLLARLEQENKRLEKDPKALHIHPERPPSLAKLRKMMDNPDPNTLRYSMLPAPPPLTDLEVCASVWLAYRVTDGTSSMLHWWQITTERRRSFRSC